MSTKHQDLYIEFSIFLVKDWTNFPIQSYHHLIAKTKENKVTHRVTLESFKYFVHRVPRAKFLRKTS